MQRAPTVRPQLWMIHLTIGFVLPTIKLEAIRLQQITARRVASHANRFSGASPIHVRGSNISQTDNGSLTTRGNPLQSRIQVSFRISEKELNKTATPFYPKLWVELSCHNRAEYPVDEIGIDAPSTQSWDKVVEFRSKYAKM